METEVSVVRKRDRIKAKFQADEKLAPPVGHSRTRSRKRSSFLFNKKASDGVAAVELEEEVPPTKEEIAKKRRLNRLRTGGLRKTAMDDVVVTPSPLPTIVSDPETEVIGAGAMRMKTSHHSIATAPEGLPSPAAGTKLPKPVRKGFQDDAVTEEGRRAMSQERSGNRTHRNLLNSVDVASPNEKPHNRLLQTTLIVLADLLNKVDVASSNEKPHNRLVQTTLNVLADLLNRVDVANPNEKSHNRLLQTTLSVLADLHNKVDVASSKEKPHNRLLQTTLSVAEGTHHVSVPVDKVLLELDDKVGLARNLKTLRCHCWAWMALERAANRVG
ncbi:MAG: uncharacterized protein KVP18_002791 [Porospora cf. gigantea A]|uniref:uncharacterized protein n=1 Tax=Porospora cf. gigantea A TaxID=2853593 RepID=UPI003559656D|nr:MAG: hypothetical protein KVP18_002791 [Porospora cf. gigantea A]